MTKMTRRAALQAIAAGSGLIGLGVSGSYFLRELFESSAGGMSAGSAMGGTDMMGSEMMGSATQLDMSTYMELFQRHTEIRRTVEKIPGGIRTITESDAPELVSQLQTHVSSMYEHLDKGAEVSCMSQSLPTLFRHSKGYRRHLTLTKKGVAVTETSQDQRLTSAIREHSSEVSGFVREGMPAMMQNVME
jgi:hypothetical protein